MYLLRHVFASCQVKLKVRLPRLLSPSLLVNLIVLIDAGARPFDNFESVMFETQGQDFNTVMGAISSNNPRWGIMNVTMRFKRGSN